MLNFLKNLFQTAPKPALFPDPTTYPYWFEKFTEFQKDSSSCEAILIGDSISDALSNNSPELFSKQNFVNHGIAGDTTIGVLKRLDLVIAKKPKKIFMLIGTNNLGTRIVPRENDLYIYGNTNIKITEAVTKFIRDYVEILTKLTKALPETKIYCYAIFPMNNEIVFVNEDFRKILKTRTNLDIINTNILLAGVCNLPNLKNNVTYIDLFAKFYDPIKGQAKPDLFLDGLHPNRAGYDIWLPYIKQYL